MKEQEMKRLIEKNIPETPEAFHDRMNQTLNSIVVQERCQRMLETKNVPVRRARRLSFALTAALSLVLVAAVAVAAIHWNVFDHLFGNTPENADQVMQSVVCRQTVNNVEITVDEAGYDGKTLYLQWRYRMLDVDRTLGDPDESGLYPDDLQLLDDHNVGWWIDHIWINGKAIDMPANSAGDERGSSVPGEIIESWSYRLDNEDLYLPDGQIEISLPIGERQPLDDYSLLNHPEVYEEDGTLKLPEKGMVTFQLKTDMRSKVKVEKPEQWTEMPDLRACVSEADYTPIMMYVTLKLEGNPDSLAKFIEENGEGYLDENGELLWPYSGMDVYGEWASGLTLVDGDGKEVFPGMQEEYGFVYGCNGHGDNWAEYLFPYRESYPAEMWLAPMENGTADMTKAVRVR